MPVRKHLCTIRLCRGLQELATGLVGNKEILVLCSLGCCMHACAHCSGGDPRLRPWRLHPLGPSQEALVLLAQESLLPNGETIGKGRSHCCPYHYHYHYHRNHYHSDISATACLPAPAGSDISTTDYLPANGSSTYTSTDAPGTVRLLQRSPGQLAQRQTCLVLRGQKLVLQRQSIHVSSASAQFDCGRI